MAFKRLSIRLTIRVILIILNALALAWAIYNILPFTILLLSGILILQTGLLIHSIHRTQRDLSRLLENIRHGDYSGSFTNSGETAHSKAYASALNTISEAIRHARMEKESQYQYLQSIVEHVRVGLIVSDKTGKVEICNGAAGEILKIPYLKHLDGLGKVSEDLRKAIGELKTGEHRLVKVWIPEPMQLSVQVQEFSIRDKELKLISLQNIRSEMEQQELETWQKLIRVLTHEIMNSVAPITSLSAATMQFLEKDGKLLEPAEVDEEMLEDIRSGIGTIRKRSESLMTFVESYRDLSRIPKPVIGDVKVKEVFGRIEQLMKAEVEAARVELKLAVEHEQMTVKADAGLLEQALLNLVLNALEAVKGRQQPQLRLTAFYQPDHDKVNITVADNGKGIPDEIADKIFIPFFTTRADGSGIGLSLVKQIVRLHNGSVTVRSRVGEGTEFQLVMFAG